MTTKQNELCFFFEKRNPYRQVSRKAYQWEWSKGISKQYQECKRGQMTARRQIKGL